MGIVPFCIAVGCAVAGIVYLTLGNSLMAMIAAVVSFFVLPVVLLQHFSYIHRLRFQKGLPERAVAHLRWWRPILKRGDYLTTLSGPLVEARKFEEVKRLLDDPSLGSEQRANLAYSYHRARSELKEAAEALSEGIAQASGVWRTSLQLELARFLARCFPERLEEAVTLFDAALGGPIVKGSEPIMLSVEADLWIAAGDGARALQILNAYFEEVQERSHREPNLLYSLAEMHYKTGVAYWLEGRRDEVEEEFRRAKEICTSTSLVKEVDGDLDKLKAGLPLRPETVGTPSTLMANRDRPILREWPGGHAVM